ncbi:AraC family transcriptional regulator [Noviherbaspirillum cavernae]|uniref:AraC family transcriptional regulator n=1 Tax=Noviherbaspirillum cavernae TaxID=2320862 RepID=A0A418WW61_9BURK|nr:AraC family transcriptional regulator [Noviherbaspirillum cavernae]RJF96946.1 AraC family transcriptional regulator [Noviherbaspirillum cavernae]
MDILSEILTGLRSEGIITGRFTLGAPWSFVKNPVNGAPFRIATENPFWVRVRDAAPVLVQPGDLIVLPHGDEHIMSSAPVDDAILFDKLLVDMGICPLPNRPLAFRAGGDGPVTDLYTGIILYREHRRNPLLNMLPPMIHIRAADITPWLMSTMKCFIEESMACQLGWNHAAACLADLLFVHVIRIYLQANTENICGWLRGLSDGQISRSLLLMHKEPQREWSVDALALAVGMSRSRFTARFQQLVGESPISYLTAHRMYIAAEHLAAGKCRISEVAAKVGYNSEKSFTRAFRRWSGVPPRTYLRSSPVAEMQL